jgi:hypothetical protein
MKSIYRYIITYTERFNFRLISCWAGIIGEVSMSKFILFRRMNERLDIDKSEGDTSAFFTLLYYGEMLTKLVLAGMLAAVQDDKDRSRYTILHRVIRADGIGEWVSCLDQLLTGPISQFVQSDAVIDFRELMQRYSSGDWHYDALYELKLCAGILGAQIDPLGNSGSLRQWFMIFSTIRNKTRGHGAPIGSDCGQACVHLEKSIHLVTENLPLFTRPWVYLHQNLSGKYRITPISQLPVPTVQIQTASSENVMDGVYISFTSLSRSELIFSDPNLSDFLFPNGRFRGGKFELLSYITGFTTDADATPFMNPPQKLPDSHTHPLASLDVIGRSFTNIPQVQQGYIPRDSLEEEVIEQLLLEPHRIITLTGTGGIGKTSLALACLHNLAKSSKNRFDIILWFSARDIDLLEHGPKPVRPQALTLTDFASTYVELTEPIEATKSDFDQIAYFGNALSTTSLGSSLYVFDNFETVINPTDVFKWIDTYIRAPNKILITTRSREFVGDYPIEIHGLTEHQARLLIASYSKQLGIYEKLTEKYISSLVDESAGHPYVIKVLLGEIAASGSIAKPERIVASKDEILIALFERTYAKLSVSAQRIFLLLSDWRSVIPEIAVEAVMLRPGNEYIDIESAIKELKQSSLIEIINSPQDNEPFINVPLAAATFGKRKLTASPLKAAVEADMSLLRDFGAARKEDIRFGILPRVRRMLAQIRERLESGEKKEEDVRPIFEFLARRSPQFWLDIAEFYLEQRNPASIELAKNCYRRYLEAPPSNVKLLVVWKSLAELCETSSDYSGALHALVGMCECPEINFSELSIVANRINNIIFALKRMGMPVFETEERRLLLRRVVKVISQYDNEMDAVDCSRVAWLYLNLGDETTAKIIAQKGLNIDNENEYCQRILDKLSPSIPKAQDSYRKYKPKRRR